jgi:predicted Zn-dependent protease
MKHWTALIVIALVSVGAIYWAAHKKVNVQASPDAMMYFVADSEHELTRLPMAMTRMSDEDEIRLGNEMASRYDLWRRPGQESPEDRQVREYIEQVGARVAVHAHRKLPYKFHYIPQPYFANAFALPGGHVFIGQGLINLMDSEDELANVLGHEVEHIDLNHCVERVQIEARMRRLNLGVIGALANIPIQVFEAGYSKDQELAADREGTRIAVRGNYSPEGAVRMFETFEQFEPGHQRKPDSPQQEMANVALSSLTEYFRTHPPSAVRAEQIRKLIADEKWPLTKETDLKIAYLRYGVLAQSAFGSRKYQEAIQYARRSLDLYPRQSHLVRLTARAQFILGDFAASAQAYRSLLMDYASAQPEDEQAYADALAALRSKSVAAEFDKFASSYAPQSDMTAMSVKVDRAGLHLVSGDTKLADGLGQELTAIDKDYTADLLARLAWWYYRAGNPQRSSMLFEQAIQLRPQEWRFRAGRAWPEIELRHYDTALTYYGGSAAGTEATAIRAVGEWLANNREGALRDYDSLANDSSWSNRNWVQGNYSPTVVSVIDQMKEERERRLAKR